MTLEPGDIFFTRGGAWISRMIRWAESRPGNKGEVNHVGLVVARGDFPDAEVIEALRTVQRHTLRSEYGGSGTAISVYRPLNISTEQLLRVLGYADRLVGQKYDYAKIALHLVDGLLGKVARREVVLARRLAAGGRGPICSWVVAQAFGSAGLTFGVPGRAADPDDIYDFCRTHPEIYGKVRDLVPL